MRNSLIGIALALVLVGVLFAGARYGSHPAVQQPVTVADQDRDPAAVVAALKPDFIGQTSVGNWKMSCTKQRELPKSPGGGMPGTSGEKRQGPPPGFKLPHCNVSQSLRNPKDPNDEVRMTLRRMGFQSVLAIFLRFPPQAVETGDMSTLAIDGKDIPMPIRTCAMQFCLSIMSVKKVDEPALLKTKTMTLKFTSRASGKEVIVPFKMRGFAEAVGAMRRMDQ